RVGDAAIADPSEANRARLVALIGTAQALGFADIETLGLQKMDAALRTLAARLLARAQQAGGTPNEAAVTQEARTELEEVLRFVNTDGAALQSVDPALASYLQAAINSLGGINFTVARIFALTCGRSVVSPFSPFSAIPAPPLPYSVGVTDCSERVDVSIKRVGANAVELDVDLDEADHQYAGGGALVAVTLPRAGTLDIDMNPAWATSAPASPNCCLEGHVQVFDHPLFNY